MKSRTRSYRRSDPRLALLLDRHPDPRPKKSSKISPKLEKMENCPDCDGDGCEPGTRPVQCQQCGGTGQASRSQGFFTVRTTCPSCRGRGQTIPNPCPNCRGAGQEVVHKKVSVKIPGGVDTGSRLRLTAEGEVGAAGGPPGDLYVFIQVKPHKIFTRNDTDVITRVQLSYVQAALGDKIAVPTLEGEEALKITKGTQYGDTFRLRGVGIPSLRGYGRGDQIIQVEIQTPTKLTKKQESLLREFSDIESDKLKSKIKKIFKGQASKASK